MIRIAVGLTPSKPVKRLIRRAQQCARRYPTGHHPLLAYCDNTTEALAGMLRAGSAVSNTVTDHLQVLDDAIAALPPKHRRRLMVTAVIRGHRRAACHGR